MQKHVNLVHLVKSFPTNIFLQNLASKQKRTSVIKFAQLAEKSEKGSISNLSTKVKTDLKDCDYDLQEPYGMQCHGDPSALAFPNEDTAFIDIKVARPVMH